MPLKDATPFDSTPEIFPESSFTVVSMPLLKAAKHGSAIMTGIGRSI
jgi:hypothetical protein